MVIACKAGIKHLQRHNNFEHCAVQARNASVTKHHFNNRIINRNILINVDLGTTFMNHNACRKNNYLL